jgi:predicted phosphodiesterase
VETDVLRFGHAHLAFQKQVQEALFINAGPVGKPKDGDPWVGYVMLDLDRGMRAEFTRIEYDVDAAASAIRNSGLPPLFADQFENGG